MRTKSLAIALLVAMAIFLSSCGASVKSNEVVKDLSLSNDVKNVLLSNDMKIAQTIYGNGGLFMHFQVPKDEVHDIHIYLYQNGVRKEIASTYNSPPSISNYDIYIADKTTSGSTMPNRSWAIYDNGTVAAWDVPYLKDNRASVGMTQGLGKMDFVMQKGKSYILAFEAFTSQDTVPASAFSDLSDQSAFESALKQGKYSDFEYIYLITINLSQGTK